VHLAEHRLGLVDDDTMSMNVNRYLVSPNPGSRCLVSLPTSTPASGKRKWP
jgi:hypothetical protein